ncbi:hypothetical protein DM02DRAFT_614800 [Periconia macrospinosa]|uniref:Secreted protein n=1 Tax=Periconia macrospinosa TaxID=97972 RepID=A0A2V1DP41_9PLEO|nr:hypothetical protein DM02DRAFT_614800 [Periconia macrospinosa]
MPGLVMVMVMVIHPIILFSVIPPHDLVILSLNMGEWDGIELNAWCCAHTCIDTILSYTTTTTYVPTADDKNKHHSPLR